MFSINNTAPVWGGVIAYIERRVISSEVMIPYPFDHLNERHKLVGQGI